ncbi:MAG: low molecular weight protein-tyrosine-phosphatase [Clostridia bacterium]|nr:low molecular weight protein-tyrosine-phosphatase [Clostridia bacterium]
MIKILFICHGNICRSPMAEVIFTHLVREAGLEKEFEIASAAVSREEIGNPVYPPARRALAEIGLSCPQRGARQMTREDYAHYDLLLGMDRSNLRGMQRIAGGDPEGKLHLLMEYAGSTAEVDDPWYSGDFTKARSDILAGCKGLLAAILREG